MRTFKLIGAIAVWLVTCSLVEARPVHYFDCKNCHTSSVSITALGQTQTNLCLKCHNTSPLPVSMTDGAMGTPTGLFHPNDASNAMGSATTVGMSPTLQTSHFWALSTDKLPAAGAVAPTTALYYSRYGISNNKLTCTRCHDPHQQIETNPKLLRMGNGSSDAMCFNCHRPWDTALNQGLGTHPIVADYEAVVAAKPSAYKGAFDPVTGKMASNVGQGDIRLVKDAATGKYKVTCTSCHGLHFADSHSGSADGMANQDTLQAGDGRLLRTDGSLRTGSTAAETAQLRSNLCQTCHTYGRHGLGKTHPIGCLDCHSGHSYDPVAPNFFVLRLSASGYIPKLGGNGTTTLSFKTATADWANGSQTGLCQGCHNLALPHNGIASGGKTQCATCHTHNGENGSFAANCTSCHGYPPTQNVAGGTPNSGFAYVAGSRDYRNAPNFKDESLTAHGRHAAPGEYKISCDRCHSGIFADGKHNNNNFQDVVFDTLSRKGMTPAYDPAGASAKGQCSNIYCHSNGGARTGDSSRNYIAASIPAWEGGNIAGCAACHGNSQATMTGKNSATHLKHLAKGYSCKVCHEGTAETSGTLAAGAMGGAHVNGEGDVDFQNTYDLGFKTLGQGTQLSYGTNGTCGIYCHSNGKSDYATPDWDNAATGSCGTCHGGGRTGATTVIASGAHAKHVSDTAGPLLTCDACHPSGSATGGHGTHVDGRVNVDSAVCNACHGFDTGETAPVWTDPASATCESCHSGATLSTINGKTAPAKALYATKGHGLSTGTYPVSGRPAADKKCTACHSASAAGHFDATPGDLRMNEGGLFPPSYAANKNGFCGFCHGSIQHHQSKTCVACHDPHGTPNVTMIYRSQATQNAKDASASGKFSGDVVFLAFTGADSFDEADGGIPGANADDVCATCHTTASHNNRANAAGDHNSGDKRGQNCTTCHGHAKAFLPVGNACNDCHGSGTSLAPNTGAHAVHTRFITADKSLGTFDVSDCDLCHSGVVDGTLKYSYDLGADVSAGIKHSDHANRLTDLAASVGYDPATKTCATACHKSAASDGAWNDANGLNCDSCHYYEASPTEGNNNAHPTALGGMHNSHFRVTADPLACTDCHGTLEVPAKGPLAHKHAKDIDSSGQITNAEWLRSQGKDFLNPGGQNVLVNDSANNGGSNSWNGTLQTCGTRQCHDPSGAGKKADWAAANTNFCMFCHEFESPSPASGSHVAHMGMQALYGKVVGCTDCHPSVGTNEGHRTGTVDFQPGIDYTGNASDFTSATWGSCGTGSCHNNGKGGSAAVAVTWGTARAETCNLCHAASPATGAHTTHIGTANAWGPYPGTGSTNCGECHLANANNTSMAGRIYHMTRTVSFTGSVHIPAGTIGNGQATQNSIASCDACHGGNTASNATAGAKKNWGTGARVSCESCHGDYSAAAIGAGAPVTAGTSYDSFGHGKVNPAPSPFGGKLCSDCHDSTSVHITRTLGDGKRLKIINGKDFGADANAYCGVCHNGGAGGQKAHYASSGGTSISGTSCVTCHTPHGTRDKNNNGLDAMMKRTIGGNEVVGFATKGDRGSYFTTAPSPTDGYGVCQVCHDPAKVSYFNQTTANNAGHNPGSVCISCHTHNNSTAFKATCNTCHGNEARGNFWPDATSGDNTIPAANNTPGRHEKHIEIISKRLYNLTVAQLLAAADSETKQRALCAYCHLTPGGDADHGLATSLPADTAFRPIWNVTATAAGTFSSGSCNNVACHLGKSTGTGTYGWSDAGASACIMCHRDIKGISGTGHTHGTHLAANGEGSSYKVAMACGTCHANGPNWDTNTPPSANHIDGNFNIGGTVTLTYSGTFPTAFGSCGTNRCHNDGKNGAPKNNSYAWGADLVSGCNTCHLLNPGTDAHVPHLAANGAIVHGSFVDCNDCHVAITPTTHANGTVNLVAGMNYTGSTSVAVANNFGTCNTATCHSNGVSGFASITQAWNRTPSSADNCTLCHAGVPATGSHAAHVQGSVSVTSYTSQAFVSTATEYKFNCTACHGSTLANHINAAKNVSLGTWNGTAKTCGQNACHQNGKGAAPAQTVTWGTTPAGDGCAVCHGNSPTTGAHAGHEVGFHYNSIYSGTTGFLPVDNSAQTGHGNANSTVISCQICHNATVKVNVNARNATCAGCHTVGAGKGNAAIAIADKRKHVNGTREVEFVNAKIRSKAQLRDNLGDVPEIGNNWTRIGTYKNPDGSSYDETVNTLYNSATFNSADKSCTVSCHLWESGRVDKVAPLWNGGSIMCIDCHTRLPK